jgi:hypothetical protein
MDVRIEQPVTQEELEEQTRLYAIVIQARLETEDCRALRFGAIPIDIVGYRIGSQAMELTPCLTFDEDHQPKPAYFSVLEVVEAHLDQ